MPDAHLLLLLGMWFPTSRSGSSAVSKVDRLASKHSSYIAQLSGITNFVCQYKMLRILNILVFYNRFTLTCTALSWLCK